MIVYCVNYFRQLTYRVKESVHLNRPTVEPNRIRKNNGRRVSINDENCGQPTGNKWAMRRNSTHVLQLGELHPPSMLLWIFLLYCCCLSCHKFDVWQIFLCQVHFYSARNAPIASAVLATAIPSVRLSVRPSVTRQYCVKTTARSTVQFAPLDSKMCLVL